MITVSLTRKEAVDTWDFVYPDAFLKRQAKVKLEEVNDFFDDLGESVFLKSDNQSVLHLSQDYFDVILFFQKNHLIPRELKNSIVAGYSGKITLHCMDVKCISINNSSLQKSDFSYADISNLEDSGSNFANSLFSFSRINNSGFMNSNMESSYWIRASATECSFDNVSFRSANMESCYFVNSNFTNCDFEFANLSSADFSNTDLNDVKMKNIIINKFTNFTGASRNVNDIPGWKLVNGIMVKE